MYVMQVKLTLRVEEALINRAKTEAAQRGKSVSQMFGEFVRSLSDNKKRPPRLPPVTASLLGVLKGRRVSEEDYRVHLREKYL